MKSVIKRPSTVFVVKNPAAAYWCARNIVTFYSDVTLTKATIDRLWCSTHYLCAGLLYTACDFVACNAEDFEKKESIDGYSCF